MLTELVFLFSSCLVIQIKLYFCFFLGSLRSLCQGYRKSLIFFCLFLSSSSYVLLLSIPYPLHPPVCSVTSPKRQVPTLGSLRSARFFCLCLAFIPELSLLLMLGQEKQGSNYGIRLLCNICIHSYKVSSKHLQSCEIWGCRGHSCSARWFACSGANLYAPGWESLVLTSRFKSSRCWKKNRGTCFVGLVGGLWGFVVGFCFCCSCCFLYQQVLPPFRPGMCCCKLVQDMLDFFLCKLSAADGKAVGLSPTWHTTESNLSPFLLRYIHF